MRALTIILLSATAALTAEPVTWRSDYTQARKEAADAKKAVCLVIGSDNCFYCKKLEGVTLADSAVATSLKNGFVTIKVQASNDPELVKALRINLFPTTVLAGPDGTIHAFINGYVSPEQMQAHLVKTLSAVAGEEKAEKAVVQSVKPQALLDVAKSLHDAKRFAEALDVCGELMRSHPGTSEAKSAATISEEIRSNPMKLAQASRQADEKAAALQLALSESLLRNGENVAAREALEKVLTLISSGPIAESAQVHLAKLRQPVTAFPATLKK